MPLTAPIASNTPSGAFERLLTIMNDLRLNCPWDKKQTLESLRHLTIEEVYELSDSILDGVTRDSLLTIAEDNGIQTEERPVSIDELKASFIDWLKW